MVAKIFMPGTKCWQSWSSKGLNMLAIIITMGSSLGPNMLAISIKKGLNMLVIQNPKRTILQSLSIGTKYACKNLNFIFAIFVQKSESRDSRSILDITSIFGPFYKRLQAYMVVYAFEIASMLSSLWN